MSSVILLSASFMRMSSLLSRTNNGKLLSSVSTVLSFEDAFSHNMRNPLLELLFNEQACGVFVLHVEEKELAKVALFCHFGLDLFCFKEGTNDST